MHPTSIREAKIIAAIIGIRLRHYNYSWHSERIPMMTLDRTANADRARRGHECRRGAVQKAGLMCSTPEPAS